jgi:hypothetical protein
VGWPFAFEERKLPGNTRDQGAHPSPDHVIQGLTQRESLCIELLVLGDHVAGVTSAAASQEAFKVSRKVQALWNRDDPPRIEIAEVCERGGNLGSLLWIRE